MALVAEASAPGRCGIVGNPSDIYGGVVVSCAVAARNGCRIYKDEARPLPDDTRIWEAVSSRFDTAGFSFEWWSEVPRSSGLSGSTATLAATMAAVAAARGETVVPDRDYAELVRDVERHAMGIVCGWQDAQMIVHGGLQRMDFAGKHPERGGPLPTLAPIPAPPELPFLLVTTGVERLSGSVHGPMVARWLAGERAVVDGMAEIAELGRTGASALAGRDWTVLGQAMNRNHAIVRDLGGSGEPIDVLVEACRRHGARGAKLAGAGLGGTVIALHEDPDALEGRLSTEGYTRFLRAEAAPGLEVRRL